MIQLTSIVGQFTTKILAAKAVKKQAHRLRRDHRAIINPEIKLSLLSAARANEKAIELAEIYDERLVNAVAAVDGTINTLRSLSKNRSTFKVRL